MSDIVIKVENLSKKYRLGLVGTGTLSHDLNRMWAKLRGKEDPFASVGDLNDRTVTGESEYAWALQNINFELKRGEVLGVIGRNGAGKSTLLKILSKITAPTDGSVKMRGRVASLLEVGTGFHPELTGRENIYLNGSIMGMKKWEIDKKLSEIIEFSGVEKYIDTPVKRYSSGMKVRLGFSVAAHLEPEILIVDEVLAVGDAEFQKKCIGKMNDVSASKGRTIIFVSHNMSAVRSLCHRGILIDNGKLAYSGSIDDTISHYLNNSGDSSLLETNEISFPEIDTKPVQFRNIKLSNLNNEETKSIHIEYSDEFGFKFDYQLNNKLSSYTYILLKLFDGAGNYICAITSEDIAPSSIHLKKIGQYSAKVKIPKAFLKPGSYNVTFMFYSDGLGPIDSKVNAMSFSIVDTKTYRGLKGKFRRTSIVAPLCDWTLN